MKSYPALVLFMGDLVTQTYRGSSFVSLSVGTNLINCELGMRRAMRVKEAKGGVRVVSVGGNEIVGSKLK